jgi:hypothetical protein
MKLPKNKYAIDRDNRRMGLDKARSLKKGDHVRNQYDCDTVGVVAQVLEYGVKIVWNGTVNGKVYLFEGTLGNYEKLEPGWRERDTERWEKLEQPMRAQF